MSQSWTRVLSVFVFGKCEHHVKPKSYFGGAGCNEGVLNHAHFARQTRLQDAFSPARFSESDFVPCSF